MDDLTFGDRMPGGYVQVIGSGSSSHTIDKILWTVVFFEMANAKLRNAAGLHLLVWKAKFGGYCIPKTMCDYVRSQNAIVVVH